MATRKRRICGAALTRWLNATVPLGLWTTPTVSRLNLRMSSASLTGRLPGRSRSLGHEWLDLVGLCVVAGTLIGIVVAGPALRVGMLVLRLTSPDSVIGVQSDDDFAIGVVTFAGTYNLFLIGAATGVLSCMTWLIVEPWLVGPRWLRLVTVTLTAALVVGPMLIHDDGIDFHALGPLWLAVAIFLLIPAAVGLAGPVGLRWAERHRPVGPWRWIVPVLCLVPFPPVAVVAVVVSAVLLAVVAVRRSVQARLLESAVGSTLARATFLVLPSFGAVALVADLVALTG